MKLSYFRGKLPYISIFIFLLFISIFIYSKTNNSSRDTTQPPDRHSPAAAPKTTEDKAWDIALEGYKHLENGNSGEALRCFQESLKLNPDSGKVLNAMGKALIASGKPDEALRYYTMSDEKQPDNRENHIDMSYVYMIRKDYDKALNILDSLPEKEKENPVTLFAAGFINANRNDYNKALPYYDKAVASDPENWQYRLYRAFTHIKLRNLEKAKADAEFALTRQPGLITCQLALAEIEWALGNKQASIEAYDKAIKMDENYKPANIYDQYLHRENPHLGRAIVYWDLHEYDKALSDLDSVISTRDNSKSIAYLYKALIYMDKGDNAKARENAKQWDSSPKEDLEHWQQPELALSEAECYLLLGEKNKAKQLLKGFKPKTAAFYGDRGSIYERLGMNKEAIADYKVFLKQAPEGDDKTEVSNRLNALAHKIR
ncbi:MAG: tetratricopeptide repeat protein [Firmicutes bacterium]|nr:tetratricopeptide repeat protein [Bacillota bacterium]